jgi:hypothetical protein
MESRAFLFHKLKKLQAQKLEKYNIGQYAEHWATGVAHRPTNVMLAEATEIPIFSRFRQLGRNYMSRCYTSSNHPMVHLLEELSTLVDNPGRGGNEQPLIREYYKEIRFLGHLIQSGSRPPTLNYTYESLLRGQSLF